MGKCPKWLVDVSLIVLIYNVIKIDHLKVFNILVFNILFIYFNIEYVNIFSKILLLPFSYQVISSSLK